MIRDERRSPKERRAERRAEWFRTNGPCQKCGSWDDLEVDHVDPSIKLTHRVWNLALAKRLEELAKCQVLCHGCHLEKTIQSRRKTRCPSGHLLEGDNLGHNNRGVRICLECKRRWTREYMRNRKTSK